MKKLYILLLLLTFATITWAQTYEDMVNRAMDYIDMKDYAAAEQALKAALRKEPANPNNIMLMVNLGTIQRNLGEYEEALISYNVAIERYPDRAFLKHSRAALYCDMGRYDDAMKDYNTVLLNDPKDIEALYRRGLLHLNNNNIFAAEEDFEKTLKEAPDNLQAKLGQALIMKRRGEFKEAEELYSDLIYKHKNNADLYFNRAECYLQLNKLARMNEDINKALELGFRDPIIYLLRGQLRLAQYDKRLAKEDFLKAQEMGVSQTIVADFLKLCK
ncbi:MAG: tetratricopeptide repeat protein [Dysgonomonas mossii]|uniref:tetratricopeptide repeat protein n=1 Tax=Dysgonomonas TaxID=156973 RepID=UPI00208EEB2E|nr:MULTISPECIES: tetratricopeptide repeat protein [Dysgonomonas]